jgi:hypothetical protein
MVAATVVMVGGNPTTNGAIMAAQSNSDRVTLEELMVSTLAMTNALITTCRAKNQRIA